MRIERVEAHVFGPLKGETLELAPGMTVVHGPNEAGKSSWHAALYAGLCGRRRGPGAGTREDRAFAERHRPWHSDRWEVGVVVELAGGRRVELRHDLAGGVECRATDLALGRDVSDEIMFEGAPDGARWLGLNRRTLPATVCVRQTDVLGVLDSPEQLQEALQRAAATGGTDATAEQALQRITAFRKERVGLDRRNSVKPLRQAVEAVAAAEASTRAATQAHEEYVRLVAERDVAEREAAGSRARLEQARAERDRAEVETLRDRLARAEALAAEAGDPPPPEPADDDAVAEQVAAALAAHDARPPAPQPLEGEDSDALAAALAALPPLPRGDVEVAETVVEAYRRWDDARQSARLHAQSRPVSRRRPETGGLAASDLRRLAETLEADVPEVDPALREQAEHLRGQASGGSGVAGTVLMVLGALLLLGGLAAAVAGAATTVDLMLAGAAAGLAGVAVTAGGVVLRHNARPRVSAVDLATMQARLAMAEERRAEAVRARDAAHARLRAVGLPADAQAVRGLAREVEVADGDAERTEAWQARAEELASDAAEAATALWESLRSRGESLGEAPDPGMAYRTYEHACRRRAQDAAQAARGTDLRARLAARQAAETDARDRLARRRAAAEALEAAALAAGEDTSGDAAEIAARLREWQRRRSAERQGLQRRRDAWLELQHLLDGSTVGEWREELARRSAALPAGTGLAGGGAGEVLGAGDHAAGMTPSGDRSASEHLAAVLRRIEALETENAEAERRAAHLDGQVADRQRDLPSVPEAEEALARATEAVARLRALDGTLEATRRFLEDARDRVHRDIAPQLKAAVERRLAAVTRGRYDQVLVDPATLHVQVRAAGAPWRSATALSHGTAEQVYLLLRLAMAEHLVTGGEVAPLVLDDVTVQSDHGRTEALLDLLHGASMQRQVILFTQEDEVLDWATRHLRGPQDALVRLEPIGVAL